MVELRKTLLYPWQYWNHCPCRPSPSSGPGSDQWPVLAAEAASLCLPRHRPDRSQDGTKTAAPRLAPVARMLSGPRTNVLHSWHRCILVFSYFVHNISPMGTLLLTWYWDLYPQRFLLMSSFKRKWVSFPIRTLWRTLPRTKDGSVARCLDSAGSLR